MKQIHKVSAQVSRGRLGILEEPTEILSSALSPFSVLGSLPSRFILHTTTRYVQD